MLPSAGVRDPASGGGSPGWGLRGGWGESREIVKARESTDKAGDPVRSQPEVPDVELRRVGETTEEVVGRVGFPTAAFGTGWVN